MDFGDILDDKRKCKEIALRHWNEGRFTDGTQLRTPKVGESWPKAFMPHWRKAIRDRASTKETRFNVWATIDDLPFWKTLVGHLNDEVVVGRGLAWAGMHGNMAAFKAASAASLNIYASHIFSPAPSSHRISRLAFAQAKIVHPDVVVFMRDKGYWDQAHISELVQAYSVDELNGASILRIDPMSRGLVGFEPSFYLEWFVKSLELLDWSADEQARFIAHMFTHVDRYLNVHQMVAENPGTHPELDVEMLMLALGANPTWAIRSVVSLEEGAIYATIHAAARAMQDDQAWVSKIDSHPGVSLRMDLMPPQSAMELYRLGCACKKLSHAPTPMLDTLALPTM